MSDFVRGGEAFYRDRRPMPDAKEKAARKAQRETEAAVARAEHKEREAAKYANMERLRAERLKREDTTGE